MLVPNSNIWETRIQNVDALLTASGDGRNEVYYLATVCQVGIDPPLVSISPNPEYPICSTIEAAGYFGLGFLAEGQGALIDRCIELDRDEPDKIAALGLTCESTENGTALLTACIQALECKVERVFDSGDHRTYIGRLVERRPRRAFAGHAPHRFGGGQPASRRLVKRVLCQSGVYDLATLARNWLRPPPSLHEGTAHYIPGASELAQASITPASQAADLSQSAPPPGICLVGCGWWGSVHALQLREQGARIRRYFASRDLQRAQEFVGRFDGEEAFDGLEAALSDPRVDAVILALPHHLHAEATRAALAAGKHVLVEKPLALSVEEGEELVRTARSGGLCLAVAEQYRLSPLVRRAHEIIQSGELGRIDWVAAGAVGRYRPAQAWKRSRETMGGGVLLDVGVHYIDVLRLWFGEPDLVWAIAPSRESSGMEGDETASAILRFRSGPIAELTVSWCGHRDPEAPNIEVIGERGALQISWRRPYIVHTAPLPETHWTHRLRGRLPWRIERRLVRFFPASLRRQIVVEADDLIGSRALIDDFVRAVRGEKATEVPGAEGLRDLEVVLAAYRALETGEPVSLRLFESAIAKA